MSVTVTEKFESRDVIRGNNPSAQLNFIVSGTDDYDAALTELERSSPAAFDNLPRLSYGVEPVTDQLCR